MNIEDLDVVRVVDSVTKEDGIMFLFVDGHYGMRGATFYKDGLRHLISVPF